MNFLPGTLRRAGGSVEVELNDGTRLPAPPDAGGADGQPVVYGTRPEHLTLVETGGLAVQVAVLEPTGMDTFVACRHAGSEIDAVFRERHSFAPGSTIRLLPDARRAHVFDAGSGQRLIA
jgi:multiple sugar transport system ATP-binding protein